MTLPVTRLAAVTGDSYYRAVVRGMRGEPYAWYTSAEGPLGRKAARHGLALPASFDEVSDAPPAIAHLNRDRWLVACPVCVGDYQFAFAIGLFMCSRCWNEDAGGLYRRVVFPDQRAAIERALASAPREARNWLPGWSVERAAIEAGAPRDISTFEYREALATAGV